MSKAGAGARCRVSSASSSVSPDRAPPPHRHSTSWGRPRAARRSPSASSAPHDTLIAFLSSGCITCHGFWDAFRDSATLSLPKQTRLVIATQGPEQESAAKVLALSPPDVPVVMSTDAWEGYGVPGAPYFIHVDGASGRVLGEGAASTWAQVASLFQQAVDDGPTVSAEADATREARADRELLAAGITPDHPSLYPPTET